MMCMDNILDHENISKFIERQSTEPGSNYYIHELFIPQSYIQNILLYTVFIYMYTYTIYKTFTQKYNLHGLVCIISYGCGK